MAEMEKRCETEPVAEPPGLVEDLELALAAELVNLAGHRPFETAQMALGLLAAEEVVRSLAALTTKVSPNLSRCRRKCAVGSCRRPQTPRTRVTRPRRLGASDGPRQRPAGHGMSLRRGARSGPWRGFRSPWRPVFGRKGRYRGGIVLRSVHDTL
jgi:hypothetical protein